VGGAAFWRIVGRRGRDVMPGYMAVWSSHVASNLGDGRYSFMCADTYYTYLTDIGKYAGLNGFWSPDRHSRYDADEILSLL
jgi:hypothetical protein